MNLLVVTVIMSQCYSSVWLSEVRPAVVRTVIQVESGGNPTAVSPAGAVGLMQMTPIAHLELRTAKDVPPRCRPSTKWSTQLHMWPEYSTYYGTCYLELMCARHSSLRDALAAYNAGSSRVRRYYTTGKLPLETWAYLHRIAYRLTHSGRRLSDG